MQKGWTVIRRVSVQWEKILRKRTYNNVYYKLFYISYVIRLFMCMSL